MTDAITHHETGSTPQAGGGYRRVRRTFRLTYDDYPGLWLRARSINSATFIELSELHPQADKPEAMRRVYEIFGNALIDWNLEDEDGTPLEPSLKTLLGEEMDLVRDLLQGWMTAMTGVSGPLGNGSNGGEQPTPMESIPMEPLSPNPTS